MKFICTRCPHDGPKLMAGSLDASSQEHIALELSNAAKHSLIPVHMKVIKLLRELETEGWNPLEKQS